MLALNLDANKIKFLKNKAMLCFLYLKYDKAFNPRVVSCLRGLSYRAHIIQHAHLDYENL